VVLQGSSMASFAEMIGGAVVDPSRKKMSHGLPIWERMAKRSRVETVAASSGIV